MSEESKMETQTDYPAEPKFPWVKMVEIASDDLCSEDCGIQNGCYACVAIKGTRWALQMRSALTEAHATITSLKRDNQELRTQLAAASPEPPDGNWPEDSPYENGNYFNVCFDCGNTFIGHKRRVQCKLCAASQPTQKAVDWISVKDRMPDPSRENPFNSGRLLIVRDGNIDLDCFWFKEEAIRQKGNDRYTITHWMPLPAAPPESKENR